MNVGDPPQDILVNNAGITWDNIRVGMKDEKFDEVIATNLKGAFNLTRGVIIGLMGNAGQANHAASKAGLVGLAKSVAKELASRGIRCNAIAPGFIRTDVTVDLSETQVEALKQLIQLGALGEADDVAGAARFLVGPGARYITGQVLSVDGGMVM